FFAFFCTLFLATGFSDVYAQTDVSVEATVSENTIYSGERIQLSIKISGNFNDISRPELPSISGFRVLSNYPSTSRSFQYINGKTSVSYSYSYQLIAQEEGDYTIPELSVTIDGEEFKTEPIEVSITDRNSPEQADGAKNPDIFLQMEVSDAQPVVGQQIIANVVLYFQDGLQVNSYQPIPGWKAEGFWKEKLNDNQRPKTETTIRNGVRYRRARLLQFALFPTKSGELKLGTYEVDVSVHSTRSRGNAFSSFFGNFGNNRKQIDLKTDPVTINVKSLPQTDSSSYFGAVGDFNISRKIDSQEIMQGETIEITTAIKGAGNLPLLSKPTYQLPDGLEVYEPQETSDINHSHNRISGTKTFKDIIVGRKPGEYIIPSKEVVYFDPKKNEYIPTKLASLHFNVKRNPNKIASNSGQDGQAVTPITGLTTWITPQSKSLLSYWWFWLGIISPVLILGFAYWRKYYLDRMATDRSFLRSQKAAVNASERLEEAVNLSRDGRLKPAYNKLRKALTGFIGDRLNLPEAGLSNQQYIQ